MSLTAASLTRDAHVIVRSAGGNSAGLGRTAEMSTELN